MSKALVNETRLRQHDRHAVHYAAYESGHHAEINQARRLVKHLEGHPGDACAIAALGALPAEVLAQVPGALDQLRAGSA
ncbi:MAG: hypothetical protein ACM31L_12580 [Actinomycetota bacterium]